MLNYYFVMHSTVTILLFCRLSSITSIINNLNQNIMRTLNSNQLTSTSTETKTYTWNTKRRYR
ncbi:hypothetical protein SAMN04515667_2139 [Formosa sp. Hel1_31_208]|nr:hypothetical protein SAMN04515667_2139 [Formosa sp. Hel1_31_208]